MPKRAPAMFFFDAYSLYMDASSQLGAGGEGKWNDGVDSGSGGARTRRALLPSLGGNLIMVISPHFSLPTCLIRAHPLIYSGLCFFHVISRLLYYSP